jgi:hypothetical protein
MVVRGISTEKSAKALANELRESVKERLAEGFETNDNEILIDGGSSLILRVDGVGGTDVEIKIIVKKDQFDFVIEEEEEKVEVAFTGENEIVVEETE